MEITGFLLTVIPFPSGISKSYMTMKHSKMKTFGVFCGMRSHLHNMMTFTLVSSDVQEKNTSQKSLNSDFCGAVVLFSHTECYFSMERKKRT